MNKMTLRLKSGKEFNFQCEEFEVVKSNVTGALAGATFNEARGECPVYFRAEDVESITWHKPLEEAEV